VSLPGSSHPAVVVMGLGGEELLGGTSIDEDRRSGVNISIELL